jgi:hypothetical protein
MKGTIMTPYQIAELWGKIEWTTDSALAAARKQNWQEFDKHMEKVSELRASLPVENSRTVGVVHLKDTMEKQGEVKIRIGIEQHSLGLFIHPEGTGTVDGPYAPILLEQHEGTLMLVVWADINQQEPTHLIDLSEAMESNRTDTD